MSQRKPDPVVIDLSRHAISRCDQTLADVFALVDTHEQRMQIATMVLAHVAGMAGAAFANIRNEQTTDAQRVKCTCAVLDCAKEIVSKGPEKVAAEIAKRHSEKRG